MKNKNQTSKRYLHTTLLSLASIILILTMIATLAHSAEVAVQWNSVADMISKMPPRLGAAGGSHE